MRLLFLKQLRRAVSGLDLTFVGSGSSSEIWDFQSESQTSTEGRNGFDKQEEGGCLSVHM